MIFHSYSFKQENFVLRSSYLAFFTATLLTVLFYTLFHFMIPRELALSQNLVKLL